MRTYISSHFLYKNICMNTIKTFEEFIKIPINKLRKQYVNFKSLVKSPPTFGDPLMLLSKKQRLNEGENRKTFDIKIVKETIIKNYNLEEEQFVISTENNDIKVAIIVPHIDDNENMIIEDMKSLGYYETIREIIEIDNMEYKMIRFDTKYLKNRCTENKIPYNAVVDVKEKNFKK